MDKQDIRISYRQKRRALSASEQRAKNEWITDRFLTDARILACLRQPDAIVHTYLPIHDRHEVDTWPIIHHLRHHFPQVRIWSSVTEPQGRLLLHFLLTPGTSLTNDARGIPTPVAPVRYVSGQPGLVIVPLLTFDGRGHRVGYGGGYYDRFLAQTGPDCLKIGLSFFEPVDEIAGIEVTDIRLDGCVTPEQACWFG